jgi:hypothetical protein
MAEFEHIFQIKILLAEIEWPVRRRIQIPETCTFWELYVAINNALEWAHDGVPKFSLTDSGFSTTPVQGDLIWGKQLAGYLSVSRPVVLCQIAHWLMTIELEAVKNREGGKHYPLFLEGEGASPDLFCGPDPFAKVLHKWRRDNFSVYGNGPLFDINVFQNNVVFDDPNDVWLWKQFEEEFLERSHRSGEHKVALPNGDHLIALPVRSRDLLRELDVLPEAMLTGPIEKCGEVEAVRLRLQKADMISLVKNTKRNMFRLRDERVHQRLTELMTWLKLIAEDLGYVE